jgi:hypothetical protein
MELVEPPVPVKPGRTNKWIVASMIASVLIIACACSVAFIYTMGRSAPEMFSDLQARRQTEEAVTFATRAAAAADLEHPPDDWVLLQEDHFEDESTAFPLGSEAIDFGTINRSIMDGVYRWQVQPNQQSIWPSCNPNVGNVTDFFASVEVERLSEPAGGFSIGLMFRINGNEHYVMESNGCGLIKVPRRTLDGGWDFTLGWEDAPLQCEGSNKLAVLGKGSHFWFFVNDAYVADVEDASISRGSVGLSVSVYDDHINETIRPKVIAFDNFQVYVPPDTELESHEGGCADVTSAP